jgi:LacI family transcriptional regulator
MRRRVLAAVDRLGYEPDFLAQSLRSGDTLTIGFVLTDIANALAAELTLGAEVTLRASGYTMLVLNSESDPQLEAQHLRLLERRRVDGVLVTLTDESNPQTLRALHELSVPWVLVDRNIWDSSLTSSAVLVDHEQTMVAVVAHLADLGHRTIGLVGGSQLVRPGREAVRAFIAACSERGLLAIVDAGPRSPQHGYEATSKMLSAATRPTALISGSNELFPGVLRAVRERGLDVPGDISLVTFDDLPLLDLLDPPIDVVKRPARECGVVGGELLLRRIAGGEPELALVMSEFQPRGSSGPPPAPR